MEIKKVNFKSIEREWNELYKNNDSLTPYMDYSFQKQYKNHLWFSVVRMGYRYICYEIIDQGEVIAIVPVIRRGNRQYIAGDLCATGNLDIVCDKEIFEKSPDFLEFFTREFKGLSINKLNEKSVFYSALSKVLKYSDEPSVCVNIPFSDDFDSYFSGLKKSVRQNYRTAKNRMNREEKKWEVRTYGICDRIEDSSISDCMKIYKMRMEQRLQKKVSFLESFVRETLNPITVALNKNKNVIWSVLYIEDKVAGFFAGFVNNEENTVVVPRLAINDDFSLYCPGNLLIIDTIKYLIENTKIRNIDLSRGDEPYKYALGGENHYNYTFKL